jgi:hypothetical protein
MNFNAGLRGVLFEAHHCELMGSAIWLYGWLVLRQTHQADEIGWVLGGTAINYREIEEETGFNRRTLERWMRTLREHGYVVTEATGRGIIVRITKAKKFAQNRPLFHRQSSQRADNPAGGVREFAEASTQARGPNSHEIPSYQSDGSAIYRSFIDREIERQIEKPGPSSVSEVQRQKQNQTSKQNPNLYERAASEKVLRPVEFLREAKLRLELMRAEREEAVRRELAVGGGPEVKRP